MDENVIKVGTYIVVQRQNYRKLHKYNKTDSSVTLGRDSVELKAIDGCYFHSIFKMIPKKSKKGREFTLELTSDFMELKSLINITQSGSDNRQILDDGKSQKLTALEIDELRSDNATSADIVETLISNSNTFHQKTEFSQEKYLKKKEKKYFEYIQILKPNMRMIAEIMYRQEPSKILNLRMDTISQIVSYSNINCYGNHLLYDSGSNGLLTAALLSAIGANTKGKLLHMHPGNQHQKQALLALNLPSEQLEQCTSVNIYSALRQYYQGTDRNTCKKADESSRKRLHEVDEEEISKKQKTEDTKSLDGQNASDILEGNEGGASTGENISNGLQSEPKKPKWHFDNIKAEEMFTQKLDSLVIACKEDPLNIFNELSKFIKPGRPFVVYHPVLEPLKKCFLELKSRANVSVLKLTNNWLRNYQVLPERTHPEVNMNQNNCYILTGYILQ